MKKLAFFFPAMLFMAFTGKTPAPALSDAERKFATDFLLQTEAAVINAITGLSDAQLNFKPAPDKWSVGECIKHIAVTEQGLWQMTNGSIQAAANPEKRSEIKASDEQVIQMIESRENKVKTFPSMEPQNTPYKSAAEAMHSFIADRAKLVRYVSTTGDDLRNHVATLPMGSFDSYQMILFIGAHSYRHLMQIEEVKADPAFPKQ